MVVNPVRTDALHSANESIILLLAPFFGTADRSRRRSNGVTYLPPPTAFPSRLAIGYSRARFRGGHARGFTNVFENQRRRRIALELAFS